jgi:hypothetical protein
MRILLVASIAPRPFASGWERRVYQLEQDLAESCDAEVEVFDAGRAVREYLPQRPKGLRALTGVRGLEWLKERLSYEVRKGSSDPLRILRGRSGFSTDMLRGAALAHFKEFLGQREPFDALVCDNVMFSAAVTLMEGYAVPCYYALHHIESLHYGLGALLKVTRSSGRKTAGPTKDLLGVCGDLAAEIAALSYARRVFAISRMEHEFLAATGINADYHPYQPKGETRRWCEGVCSARKKVNRREPMIFLSSGTETVHNRKSLAMVVRELFSSGMPPGCELIITGMEAHYINDLVPGLADDGVERGIRVAGTLSSADFERLLISAAALVIPNYFGFGALTRFSDAATCGIPVLTNVSARISGLLSHEALLVDDPKGWWDTINKFTQSGLNIRIASQATVGEGRNNSVLRKIRSDTRGGDDVR